ncbi:MAG: nucleotidyltransferase family protein [Marinirhabdus sp.]
MNDEPLFFAVTRLTKVVISSLEKDKIIAYVTDLKNKVPKQQKFFEYCLEWKLAPWVFLQLKKHALDPYFESEILHLFQEEYSKIKLQNTKRNEEAIRFLKLFKKHGIDVAILKGNLFANTFYGDVGYKRMNDFDILIHANDWVKVQTIYEELNYIPLGFGWAGEKQKPANFSHVGTPFISSNFLCIVGTQWGIKAPTARYKVDINKVWKNTIDPSVYGAAQVR